MKACLRRALQNMACDGCPPPWLVSAARGGSQMDEAPQLNSSQKLHDIVGNCKHSRRMELVFIRIQIQSLKDAVVASGRSGCGINNYVRTGSERLEVSRTR